MNVDRTSLKSDNADLFGALENRESEVKSHEEDGNR